MRRLSEDREGFRRRFTVLKTDLSLGYTFRKYDAVMYGGMEKTMSRLAIITDSNSGITQSRGKELGIFVLPMPFFIDGQLFLEDITLTQEQFYDRLGGDSDISTLIFDISKQLCLNVHIYDFEPDNHFSNEVEDECNTLSRIFERKFYIERSNSQNPVLYLQKLQLPILHFLPFSAAITKNRFSAFIRTRFEALAFMIDTNPQFFLPINE